MPFFARHVFVCTNERPVDNPKGSCARCGGVELREAFKAELAKRGLHKIVRANGSGCIDMCAQGAAVVVYPEQVWYGHVSPADVPEIVDQHLVAGHPVTRLMVGEHAHLAGVTLPPLVVEAAATTDAASPFTGPTKP